MRDRGTSSGTIAALGVTIKSACSTCHVRHCFIGSHEEHAIDQCLSRALVIDNRRIDLEHRRRIDGARREDALAAEVVIALDHDIRPHADGEGSDRARAQQTKLRTIGWCADRVPVDPRIEMPGLAARRHVNLVAERRETLGDRLHVDRASERSRHDLVGGHIEHPHYRASSTRM